MNPYFSMTRFGRLARTYFIENRAALLLNMALLAAALVVIWPFIYLDYPLVIEQRRAIMLFLIGIPAWGLFTVQQISLLNRKESAITYLLRPSSLVEKYLLILMISGLGFLLAYGLLFVGFDMVGVEFVNHRNWTPTQLAEIKEWGDTRTIDPVFLWRSMERFPNHTLVMAILIHPLSLTLSSLFRRFTVPLVVLTMVILFVGGFFGNQVVQHQLFIGEEILSSLPFSEATLLKDSIYRTLELPQPIGDQLRYLVGGTVVFLLYLTAYYRLKEQEV